MIMMACRQCSISFKMHFSSVPVCRIRRLWNGSNSFCVVCFSGRDKDHAIIALAGTAGALLIALLMCCVCWCKYTSQQRRLVSIPVSYNDQESLLPKNGQSNTPDH